MGCDIHFHTEVKVNGKWEHYSHPNFPRSYYLFSLLANVRNDDEFRVTPFKEWGQIVPEDANIVTKKSLECDDYHSLTVYNSDEIKAFYEYIKNIILPHKGGRLVDSLVMNLEHEYIGYFDGNGWNYRPDWVEDVRWIFAFDN